MADDDESRINRLRFKLSCALDDARRLQDQLAAELRRQELPAEEKQFFTYDEVAAERRAERLETRELMKDVLCDYRLLHDRNYQPDAFHLTAIAACEYFSKAPGANVVPITTATARATAKEIIASGRKRRGEES